MTGHFNLKVVENNCSEGKYLVIYEPNSEHYQGLVKFPRVDVPWTNINIYEEGIINSLLTFKNSPRIVGDKIRKLNYKEFFILNQLFRRHNLIYNKKTNEFIRE